MKYCVKSNGPGDYTLCRGEHIYEEVLASDKTWVPANLGGIYRGSYFIYEPIPEEIAQKVVKGEMSAKEATKYGTW